MTLYRASWVSVHKRLRLALFGVCLVFGAAEAAFAQEPAVAANPDSVDGGNPELGKRLYWRGITEEGAPFHATVRGDIQFSGAQFSCVNCHRPSGFGSSEGGNFVPPITGPLLFDARQLNRNRIFAKLFQEAQPSTFSAQVRQPRMRPAYTSETLAKAIRTGVDPAGRRLGPIMPRYDLGDRDLANLIAYLRTLSARVDPGVDKDVIHFATVITPDIDPSRRAAFLKTVEAFFDWRNKHTEGDQSRPNFSPYYRSDFIDSYRIWKLHIWELNGPPKTWTDQLRKRYAEQPVFAMVSGLVSGPWSPVAAFCNESRVPCVFPNTELPKPDTADYDQTLYFSRGLALEARALVDHLRLQPGMRRIVQLSHAAPAGAMPARVFERAAGRELGGIALEKHVFADLAGLRGLLDAIAASPEKPDALIVWPGPAAADALSALGTVSTSITHVLLPSAALETTLGMASAPGGEGVAFAYPYELPTGYHPRAFRVRGWMRTRGLEISHPRLQFQTYYALTMLEHGLRHIIGDFYRDYFVEIIEHEAENKLNPGTHPNLALGPGQRFASKGAYIVVLDGKARGGFKAVSPWIVP